MYLQEFIRLFFALAVSFLQGKKPCHGYPTEVGDWEGKMGSDIITQMIFSGFLNEVCYCIWNEVSAMIKSFWDPVTIFTQYTEKNFPSIVLIILRIYVGALDWLKGWLKCVSRKKDKMLQYNWFIFIRIGNCPAILRNWTCGLLNYHNMK